MSKEYKIAIIIVYFGKWPPWIDYFFLSVKYNKNINWIIFNDCVSLNFIPENVKLINYSLEEFNKQASKKLDIKINVNRPYKICDFKPLYGFLFSEYITDYSYWGYSDLDIIFGDISKVIFDKVGRYDVITSKNDYLSGHFTLYRNNEKTNLLFQKCDDLIPKLIDNKFYYSLDEVYGKYSHPIRSKMYNRMFNLKEYILINIIKPINVLNFFYHKIKRNYLTNSYSAISKNKYNDLTQIVKNMHFNGELKAYFGDHIIQDNLSEIENLSLIWNNGELKDENNKEYMYLHFYHLKKMKRFRVQFFKNKINYFRISKHGIVF